MSKSSRVRFHLVLVCNVRICFSSDFWFLVIFGLLTTVLFVLFLVAGTSLSSFFLMQSSSSRIDASTLSSVLANPLQPSFLDTCSLLMSSLGCKTLCIVISFLFLWSIYWSSSLVHLKNGTECFTRETAQVFFSFVEIPAAEPGLEVFSFVWDTLFTFFSYSLVWWCPLWIFISTFRFSYVRAFRFCLDLIVLFL